MYVDIFNIVPRIQQGFRVLAADTLARVMQPGLIPEVPVVSGLHNLTHDPHLRIHSHEGHFLFLRWEAVAIAVWLIPEQGAMSVAMTLRTWRRGDIGQGLQAAAAAAAAENMFQRSCR